LPVPSESAVLHGNEESLEARLLIAVVSPGAIVAVSAAEVEEPSPVVKLGEEDRDTRHDIGRLGCGNSG
jgi:hypothetical protein